MTFTVREFTQDPAIASDLRLLAGVDGLSRRIHSSEIVRPAAAIGTGIWRSKQAAKCRRRGVWVFGKDEVAALRAIPKPVLKRLVDQIFTSKAPAVIFVDAVRPEKLDERLVKQTHTPVFAAKIHYGRFLSQFHTYVENRLAPTQTLHAAFVVVYGEGVLLTGKSGIGKSEVALALLERGHQLVADDFVVVTLRAGKHLIGRPAALGRHLLEIRGLGILNVGELFGPAAVAEAYRVHLTVELKESSVTSFRSANRLRPLRPVKILGAHIPRARIDVRPGRNMAVIVEAAALNEKIKSAGKDAQRELVARQRALIRKKTR